MIILAINNKDNIGQKEEGKQSLLTSGKYAVLDIEHKASDHFCKKQQGL
jgi:hypothetical protein